MGYDSIKKRVGDYSKSKIENDEEDMILSRDEMQLDTVAQSVFSLDSDLQDKINSVRKEYESERARIDGKKVELDAERENLSSSITSEMGKLSEADSKLEKVGTMKYGKAADTAKKKCEEYISDLQGLLGLIEESGDVNKSADDTSGSRDASILTQLFGIDDKNDTPLLNISTKSLNKMFVKGMSQTLSSSSHDNVKSIYSKYAEKLTVADVNHSGGAFYRYGDGVFMNEKQVQNGDMIHKPYQTAFHEFGHNIDYLMGNGIPISETWNNGQLYSAIQYDFDALKGNMTDDELIENIKMDMKINNYSIMDMASVSDMLECLTGKSYPLGVGHGASYWVNPTRLPCKEFFAETLDGAAANENSYQMMKKYFPSAVSVVNDILNGGM